MATADGSASPAGTKRSRYEVEAEGTITDPHDASDSSDDDIGPALPSSSAPPKKKRRRQLQHEALFVAALPAGTRYSKSLMHKSILSFALFTPKSDFLITASADGQVNFWKKATAEGDVEFVKEFKAHHGEVTSVAVSWDGSSFASAGIDGSIKVWDVVSFDLIAVINLDTIARSLCWVNDRTAGVTLLAVGHDKDGSIDMYDVRGSTKAPQRTLTHLHKKPVSSMVYNVEYDCVVSADQGGMIEYWRAGGDWAKPGNVFQMKSDTDLFAFKKSKSSPTSITLSPKGKQFAAFSFPDRKVRVFDFASGKLYRTYDESITTITEMQQAGTAIVQLEGVEFGRRLAIEQDLEKSPMKTSVNVIFDETGNFIIFGSILGAKVINTLTNKVVKLYGQDEPIRPLNLTLYQGQPEKKGVVTVAMAASDNPLLQEAEERDALLVSTAINKVRFYIFANDTDPNKSNRDVQNEKPPAATTTSTTTSSDPTSASGTSATLHTTHGDIRLLLYPSQTPRTVQNFLGHARSGYYNNVLFHRVIRKFMIQTGDPLGDGTGGESIWGGEFEDEIVASLKHDRPYALSMANAGKDTNGSQFFITTEKAPWLDGKHTIFGRAVAGLDVVHRIENVRTYKEKPEEDIRIVSVSAD